MKKILLLLILMINTITNVNACHDAGVIETSAVDNGDGTYTYTFEACTGELEDTWGFELTLNYIGGSGNLISYTNSITSTNTGVEIFASVPSTSGTGDIEYGDFDNTANPVWSDGTTNECPVIELTVDTPLESVDMFGHQFGSTNCSNSTFTTSECFSNTADYTVELSKGICNGNKRSSFTITDPDGLTIGSGTVTRNGATETFTVCGCGSELQFSSNCLGSVTVYDGDGNSLGFRNTDGATIELDCTIMPIELKEFKVIKKDGVNVIKWSTYTEINNDYFTIERSNDGENWNEIFTKSGAGNSTETITYEYQDRKFKQAINYYRLTQTDFDGSSETFNIISVDNSDSRYIMKTINIIGQEVGDNYKGIIIYKYSDGTTKKEYR